MSRKFLISHEACMGSRCITLATFRRLLPQRLNLRFSGMNVRKLRRNAGSVMASASCMRARCAPVTAAPARGSCARRHTYCSVRRMRCFSCRPRSRPMARGVSELEAIGRYGDADRGRVARRLLPRAARRRAEGDPPALVLHIRRTALELGHSEPDERSAIGRPEPFNL